MTTEEAVAILEETLAKLSEHFEVTQILVSWMDESGNGGTHILPRGSGNFYARQGMAHYFINTDISSDAASHIAAKLKENES